METHEPLALTPMGIFTAVLAWKLFRRARLSGGEELGLRVLSLAGFVGIIWTAVLGGKLVFEHAAGIPNATMQAEMTNRAAGHQHEPGEVDEDPAVGGGTVPPRRDTTKAAGSTHAPGPAPHQHKRGKLGTRGG